LPGIGSLFGSLFDPFIAITAVTAAARAGLLPSAARLARALFAAPFHRLAPLALSSMQLPLLSIFPAMRGSHVAQRSYAQP
jgi:hypothetical protein